MDDARRAQTNVDIREPDPKQTDPRPQHVARVEASHAIVSFRARRRFGF